MLLGGVRCECACVGGCYSQIRPKLVSVGTVNGSARDRMINAGGEKSDKRKEGGWNEGGWLEKIKCRGARERRERE